MTDGTGTTIRVYDAFDRTTAKTVPLFGTSIYAYDITAGMDVGCTAQTTTDPKNNITLKIYDRVGRLWQVIADGKTTVYTYNDNGSVQSVVYSDGSKEVYTYTGDNLLNTLTNRKADGTVIDSYSYTYDSAHNMLTKTDSRGITAYAYDRLNRLISVTEPSGKTTTYTFDAAGNRKTQTVVLGTDTTITTYTYDSQNRLIGTQEQKNGVTTETVVYTYDNNGNQLSKTSTAYIAGVPQTAVTEQTNTYDLFNQLISTITSTGVTVINTYNGDGRRVSKSVNGSLTRYLYEYDKVVLEANYLGDQTGRNVYGINLLTRQVGTDTFTYMYNGHADVTALLDTAGNVAATYYYDAFGNILDQTGILSNNILYAGYQYDSETGLYYLNARMYDPVTARFMQEDTYAGEYNDPLSLNLYTYCHNEPLMYSDPTGHTEYKDPGGYGTYYSNQAQAQQKELSRTEQDYEYQKKTQNTADQQHKWKTMEQKGAAQIETIASACKPQGNFLDSALSNLQSFSNSCQSAMTGYGVAMVKDLVVSPVLINAAFLASIVSPGVAVGDKITNSFGQYSKNMQKIDNIEQSIINTAVKDKKAYYGGKIVGDASSMAVSAAEIMAGTTLAAGAGLVDLVSAAFSGTGVGALVLVGSVGLTAVGVAEAEFGLTTGVGSAMYFAKDLKDFQSSGTEGGTNSSEIKNVYGSIKDAPNYPDDFVSIQNGTKKVNIKNEDVLEKLRNVESGKWTKVYKDGYDSLGNEISIHYFQSSSGKVFDVKVVSGWSN